MEVTFYLYAVALSGGKFNAEKQVFNDNEKTVKFAFDEVYKDNSANAAIVYCDNLKTSTIATIDRKSTVGDYFSLMGKLPGGYIQTIHRPIGR